MKVKDILSELSNGKSLKEEKAEKKYVVIGNPGRGLPSALYPKTEMPKLYTAAQAKKICDKLNDTPKLTYGVSPSSVHWHFKPIEDAMKYISGSKAASSIRLLTPPDPNSWGPKPAKHRFEHHENKRTNMKIAELITMRESEGENIPVYISVSGTWNDHDYERVYGEAVYQIDTPSKEVAEKIVSSLVAKAENEDVNDMIDRFEQDGWDPEDGDGHAEEISVDDVSLVKPTGRGETLVNKYTMVYFLRDLDLLDDDFAKKIAKT